MDCLPNMCYVCLEIKDKLLDNINSSLSVNKDIIHIIDYLPCNLRWMKTKRIILICEECCRRLRETYQFLMMCDKNSALITGSVANTDNEAELRVALNNKQDDIIKIKCEIKSENEAIYTFEREPPMANNSTANNDNDSDTEISVTSDTHDTDTDSDSAGFTSTQVHTTNTKRLNSAAKKPHKCPTCSKSFSSKTSLQIHTRVHTGEKPYKCATCKKCFSVHGSLVNHMRTHTGEKPYECATCKKCFMRQSCLVNHVRTHTGEKPYKCATCKKCFRCQPSLVYHTRMHTGEKPFECSRCKKCFRTSSNLVVHIRRHAGNEF